MNPHAGFRAVYSDSQVEKLPVSGRILDVSCAYSGRVAIAYQQGPISRMGTDGKLIHLCIAIFESESTGTALCAFTPDFCASHVPFIHIMH